MTPWYTDQEIDDLCAGLVNNVAKCRHLRSQGVTVTQKPNGRPLVMRAHAEAVLAGLKQIQGVSVGSDTSARNTPNKAALIALFGRSKAVA